MNKKIILQKRDYQIFKLLDELNICDSESIRNIITPKTKLKTFNLRLAKLKKEWYIKEVNKNDRPKNLHMIYSLTTNDILLNRIKNDSWLEFGKTNYNLSYSLYNHQLFLWKLISYFLDRYREKNIDFQIDFEKSIWSKNIHKKLMKEINNENTKFEFLDKVMIWDFMLYDNKNTYYFFELENTNNYNQFKNKIIWINDMILFLNNDNFFDILKDKNIVLIIWCWKYKKERYLEILGEHLVNCKYKIKIIDEI